MRSVLVVSLAGVVAACGASKAQIASDGGLAGGDLAAVDDRGLPCPLTDILDRKCRACHERKPSFGAPMPIVTRADLLAPLPTDPSRRVLDGVLARVADDARPMPPAPLARLTAEERAAIASWASGTPEAGCARQLIDAPQVAAPALDCAPDRVLAPARSYELPATATNRYVCYRADVDSSEPRQIIGIAPEPDNTTILHHVLLFRVDDEVEAARIGTTPAPCDSMRSIRWTFLYGWAPGTGALQLPPNVGINAPSKAHYVVQLHYNNAQHLGGQSDRTGFKFCTTGALRPFEADVLAFGTPNIFVPAKGTASMACDFTVPSFAADGIRVFAMNPHMHGAGTAISTEHLPADADGNLGAPVRLAAIEPWNFQDQQWSPVSAVLRPGDVVRQRCAYRNTTTRAIEFGENTEDEMCFGFTLYYPRIKTSFWSWAYPAATSTCTRGP